jgi:RNA polymerase sigma factor (sigma-70 family)
MESELLDILNHHRGLIFKVCHIYCRDTEDRKDLFQEIVYQVWKSRSTFRQESKITTWIYRIALNTAITHFRREQRHNGRQFPIDSFDLPDLTAYDGTEELMSMLFAAIESLDRIDKSIVLLYLEDKSYDEISEITGLSKSNVGVRLNRIKIKLSEKLKP